VSGLPVTGSWQDLKDHFREAGDVMFADVYKDGTGRVEFSRKDDMKKALRDLDDSKFRSHEVCFGSSKEFIILLPMFLCREILVTSG
jgi:arginine/serine-rich splicing factor 1/9